MSKVRDYIKKREQRNDAASSISYKEKIRSHKLTYFYRTLLVIILIIGATAFLLIQWNNKVFTDSITTLTTPIHITQDATAKRLGANLLIYSKDGASCMDEKGNVIWNKTFEMQNPMISSCENVVAIGDYNGRNLYIVNEEKEMGEINTEMPIHSFCVSANGMTAVITEETEATRIHIYHPTGGEPIATFKTTMSQSGYPISVSISPNGKLVGVSYVYVDSGVLKSSVAFYNFGGVGQNEDDNYMSGYNYMDSIVPYIQFMNNDTAFCVSDDRIMFFGGNERPLSIKENILDEEVRSIYYNDEYVGLVFHNMTGETQYRLDMYNKTGSLILSKNFNIDYKDIVFYKEQIIIYNDQECLIVNNNGLEKYAGTFETTILQMIPISSNYKYLLVSSDEINVINLK